MIGIGARRRGLFILVIVLIAWPPCHHVIVRSLDLSPWKGFAWSMYCEPMKRFRVGVVSLPDQAPLPGLTGTWRRELAQAYHLFVEKRQVLRRRAQPDDFARALFESHPEVQKIKIVVEQYGLDRSTSQLRLDYSDEYIITRGE